MSDDPQKSIERLAEIFEIFRGVDPTMPMQVAHSFLLVALNEGCSVGELAIMAGFSPSTTSRHLLTLGRFDRQKNPGYGLVETTPDETEPRRHLCHLTADGYRVLESLAAILDRADTTRP